MAQDSLKDALHVAREFDFADMVESVEVPGARSLAALTL
jgi:hypothetical protein